MTANVRRALVRSIVLFAISSAECERTESSATGAASGSGSKLTQVQAESGGWGFEPPAVSPRAAGEAPPSVDPRRQCRGIPEAQRESCPSEVIGRWVRGIANVDRGVVLRLSTNAGTAGQAALRFRCHHAMTRRNPAHACALNIRGLEIGVSRVGGELHVRLTTSDDAELDLLRARARALRFPGGTS